MEQNKIKTIEQYKIIEEFCLTYELLDLNDPDLVPELKGVFIDILLDNDHISGIINDLEGVYCSYYSMDNNTPSFMEFIQDNNLNDHYLMNIIINTFKDHGFNIKYEPELKINLYNDYYNLMDEADLDIILNDINLILEYSKINGVTLEPEYYLIYPAEYKITIKFKCSDQ